MAWAGRDGIRTRKTVEEIIEGTVFLHDDDDVLDLGRRRGRRGIAPATKDEKCADTENHPAIKTKHTRPPGARTGDCLFAQFTSATKDSPLWSSMQTSWAGRSAPFDLTHKGALLRETRRSCERERGIAADLVTGDHILTRVSMPGSQASGCKFHAALSSSGSVSEVWSRRSFRNWGAIICTRRSW